MPQKWLNISYPLNKIINRTRVPSTKRSSFS
jgi:hypothetical protein